MYANFRVFLILLATIAATALAQETSPIIPVPNVETVGTDDLGRSLPTPAEVGPPRTDRWVGLFYWQWHGDERWWQHYNVTDFLKTQSYFRDFRFAPDNGPKNPTWYWGEPLFGYYRSTDPWVIRKHLVMLADAGVDFLYLDYTNSSVYDAELGTLLKTARELKSAGVNVPRIVFFLNFQPEWKLYHLYETWYSKPEWKDMWFIYRGKPLMLADPIADPKKLHPGQDPNHVPTINQFFTFRKTWALFKKSTAPTRWRFIDGPTPQVADDASGKPEQIVVCKSMGGPIWDAIKNGGVSALAGKSFVKNDYSSQWLLPDAGQGVNFAAQWANAEKSGAPITLVTGWNEWKASVWKNDGVPMLGEPAKAPFGIIVDEFNQQFNRDLEPMTGGYFDNYYFEFLAAMRRYKGMATPQPASPPMTMKLDGRDNWAGVTPKYLDPPNDTADRDHDATVPDADALLACKTDAERKKLPMIHYVSKTARNDLAISQVTHDASNVYFHVTTAAPLSPSTDGQWMWLLIDADQNPKTGWHGYDLLVNRTRTADGHATIEQYTGHGFDWRPVGTAKIAIAGNEIELALPRMLFHTDPLRFDFKWADNLPANPTIADFYTTGDVAPNTRLNYRYDASR